MSAAWSSADVHRMLSPQWSVCWRPALHAKFPADQREKGRLVVFANTLALRRVASPTWQLVSSWFLPLSWRLEPTVLSAGRALVRRMGVVEALVLLAQNALAWLGSTRDPSARDAGSEGKRLLPLARPTYRWIYLPQPLVHRILEFAMFLW